MRRLAVLLFFVLLPEAGRGATPVQTWRQSWVGTDVISGPVPMAARQLADGSTMIVGPPAIRYDASGNLLSTGVFSPPYFATFTITSGPNLVQTSVVAIDPFGGVFVASVATPSVFQGSSIRGDIWLMKYDGLTGKDLWSAPAVFDLGKFSRQIPLHLLLDAAGNPVVVGTTRGQETVVLKYNGVTGAPIWGPTRLPGGGPLASLDPSGNVLLKIGSSIDKIDGQSGTLIWGPVPTVGSDTNTLAVGPDGSVFVAGTRPGGIETFKYRGTDGSLVWGPAVYTETAAQLKATNLVVDASGDLILSGTAGDHFLILKYAGATGNPIWGPLAPKANPGLIPLLVRIAGNGDVVATGWDENTVLEAWRYSGATGASVWGPQPFPGAAPTQPLHRSLTLILSDGRVLMAAPVSNNLSTLARDPATGAPVWGPVPFTTSYPTGVRVTDVSQDLDGNVLVTGYAPGFRYATVKLARSTGAILWGPVFHDAAGFQPFVVRSDASRDVFVLGDSGVVIKYSGTDGALLWAVTPGTNLHGWNLAVDSSGDVFALEQIGKLTQFGGVEYDFALFRLSGATGAPVWGPVVFDRGPGIDDWPTVIGVTPGGDVVVSGTSLKFSSPSSYEWVTLKYSGATGALLWGPALLPQALNGGSSVADLAIDAAGDLVVVGDAVIGTESMATIKYSGATGAVLWGPKTVTGTGGSIAGASAVALDANGDAFVTGSVYNTGQGSDFATTKYRGSDGVVLWGPQVFNGPANDDDFSEGLALDAAGNPVVAGTTRNAAHNQDIALLKYDGATGAPLWGPILAGGTGEDNLPLHDLVVRGNSVVIAGNIGSSLAIAWDEVFGILTQPEDIPPAYCGHVYSRTLLASGASGPVTWSLVSGSLPPGLSLDAPTGLIAGTPTEIGAFSFRVRGQDSLTFVERDFGIDVAGGTAFVPVLATANPVCPGASVTLSVSGTWSSYSWLPGGQTTPTVTVSPAEASDYGVVLTDSTGCAARGTVRITVRAPVAIQAPAAVGAGGAEYGASAAGTRASETFEWSIVNGVITSGAGTSSIMFTAGAAGSVELSLSATSGECAVELAAVEISAATCSARPESLVVDPENLSGVSDGNGVLEPGETVDVRPSWKNIGGSPLVLSGVAANPTGSPGSSYSLGDSSADYGTIGPDATGDCGTTGDCYEVSVSSPTTRPMTHWDATFTETLSDGDPVKVWTLHIGQSFTDVPKTHVFYPYVERLLHNGVTTGCSAGAYCPEDAVSRLQMAIFVARAQAGGDGNVSSSGTAQGSPYDCSPGGTSLFSDVEPSNPFCRHVHYIYGTGVTTGCEPGKYCPEPNVSRAQIAMFIARSMAGSDAAVPLSYGPDPVTGRSYSCDAGSPNLHFTDVAQSDIFCRHTHYLWAKDVISGFPDNTYQPALDVSRGAMAKFLSNGFNLRMYGP